MAMAESPTYAVLDTTKKKKNRYTLAEKTAEEPSTSIPVYSVLGTNGYAPDNVEETQGTYSMITMENLNSGKKEKVEIPKDVSATSTNKKAEEVKEVKVESISNRRFICILVTLVVVLIAAVICFIIVFAEVAGLKASAPTEMSSESQRLYLQQINQSLSSLDDRVMNRLSMLEGRVLNVLSNLDNVTNHLSSLDMDQGFLEARANSTFATIFQELAELSNEVLQLSQSTDVLDQQLGNNTLLLASLTRQLSFLLVDSCAALPPSTPSGYYWLRASNGSAVRVYCDMTRSCGGVTGGWMRVAELDMTNNSQQCPSGLNERVDGDIRTCGIWSNITDGCSSEIYSTANINYSRVCGRITAYQVGTTNGFRSFHKSPSSYSSIDSAYVDGVSLTHGSPKQHIWTFAAALDKTGGDVNNVESLCPCQSTPPTHPPSFVGTDYFCDAGNEQYRNGETGFQTDPLWDGAGCSCCAHPPWFYKQLPQPTTDDIEMRVCRNNEAGTSIDEDIAIQIVEIYIQ